MKVAEEILKINEIFCHLPPHQIICNDNARVGVTLYYHRAQPILLELGGRVGGGRQGGRRERGGIASGYSYLIAQNNLLQKFSLRCVAAKLSRAVTGF